MSRPKKKRRAGSAARAVAPALLAAALRAQSEGVFIADRRMGPKGLKILFVNDSFCAITGRPAADLVGRSHAELHDDPMHIDDLGI